MQEALLEQVLEHRHLYAQNAALKHGVVDPPRRVNRAVYQQQSVPQPSQHVSRPQSKSWKDLIVPLLIGLGIAASILIGDYLLVQNEVSSGLKPQSLLEYLEDSGVAP